MPSFSDPLTLDQLVEWMRRHGVRRARCGEYEVEFSRDPTPRGEVKPPRQLTAEEEKAEAHEERRRKYKRELGFLPTDDQLRQLP